MGNIFDMFITLLNVGICEGKLSTMRFCLFGYFTWNDL